MRPLILISNDDGYRARGINVLTEIARHYGDVVVCAPDDTRSGYSMSVTFYDALMAKQFSHEETGGNGGNVGNVSVYRCSGTPTDCVKLALETFCPRKPDLVLGGINHGDNSSVNAHYSGTMSVALEGCMKGIPSIAFSHCDHRPDIDFTPMLPYIRQVIEMVLRHGLPQGVCLNVNAPVATPYKGLRVCTMAAGNWGREIETRPHPRGGDYYWMVGHYTCTDESEMSDQRSLMAGYVTVTPIQIDFTAYGFLSELRSLLTPNS